MSDKPKPDSALVVRHTDGGYRWDGVAHMPYKDEGSAPFKAISRQILHSRADLDAELRYFEMDAGGHSTLERHEHVHGVMIFRGRGQCLVGDTVYDVGPHDLVTVPPMTWHQFRASKDAPMGFLCLVNVKRDKPQLPTEDELKALQADPAIAAFLKS
jgi:mannose-6-phosphate isomerase-like protein (cupin superfamily)